MASRGIDPQPVGIARRALAERLAVLCTSEDIDLAGGVTLPCPLPHADRWRAWLAAERHADLAYLTRDPAGRIDPTQAHPWARTLLVFAQRYTDGWDPADASPQAGAAPQRPWTDGVARYARGRDYHDVLRRAIRRVVAGLRRVWPELVARVAVDTGPYLEREYAWLAGLGFLGKNACLIHERLGSGLFLGVALTNLVVAELPAGGVPAAQPLYAVRDRGRAASRGDVVGPLGLCGRCTRCLEACPTGALVAPHELDARLCLATWSIEWRGRAPADRRADQGALIFGCDICQAVCPWNQKAARAATTPHAPPPFPAAYRTDPAHAELRLADLITLDAAAFRRRFHRSAIWRCHPGGLRRNALIVAGNTRRRDVEREARLGAASDPDAAVREVAAWAAARIGGDREEEA